ncbi:Meiotically up-regulated protein [Vanrija pseudolonga]|uniref:Meiotically up-regulated protein n=1 Tax=Vanrija pseudolonga TaxID=143232 RepID=A0AAF0Y3N0_9TREE|nr:Meiotically up-regulated protein [Vanrija pseudolonga]
MQRKALKQLNKVTQWTNEKVFSGEKTQFSEEFTEFESEIDKLRLGIERLHATSTPFHDQLTKLTASADPHPPSGSSKDKMLVGEALGTVMIDYGNDVGGAFGDGLTAYGRARGKLATVQQEFGERVKEGYITSNETALAAVDEYKVFRKKMDSRRLTLDAALMRQKQSKKQSDSLDQEVELAQQRFEEAEEETRLRMEAIKEHEEAQFAALTDLLEAERDYFTRCKEILDELREEFPTTVHSSFVSSGNRPRAKSNASARSASATSRTPTRPKTPTSRPSFSRQASAQVSDDEDSGDKDKKANGGEKKGNRSRSDSAASAGKGKSSRSIMPSFGSFGAKSKSFGKKYDNISDEEKRHISLAEGQEDTLYDPYTPPVRPEGRARAHSAAGSTGPGLQPPRRRALTSPSTPDRPLYKVLFDFEGLEADELPLKAGQIVALVGAPTTSLWMLGEVDGQQGLFPKDYVEEYEEAELRPPPALITPRRTSSPRITSPLTAGFRSTPHARAPLPRSRSHNDELLETESETELFHNNDDNASLAAAAQPPPVASANRSRSGSLAKGPAPPPPPSRRNTASNVARVASPPPVSYNRSRSSTVSRTPQRGNSEDESPFAAAQSPFAHSDDEH